MGCDETCSSEGSDFGGEEGVVDFNSEGDGLFLDTVYLVVILVCKERVGQ